MLSRILTIGLLAGFLSGLAITGLQLAWSVPLIQAAEQYEVAAEEAPVLHEHADGSLHQHGGEGVWAPEDGLERSFWTGVVNVLLGVGGGLIFTALLALRSKPATLKSGLLMGGIAFASFSLAPAAGLPPELPGMQAAELGERQVWWLATALVTAIALSLVLMASKPWVKLLAAATLLLPHLVGAPQPLSHETAVPDALIFEFVLASLVTTGVFWLLLGGLSGLLSGKLELVEEEAAAV